MKLLRRNFLHLVAGVPTLLAMPRFAWAQSYPARPVRIIIGFPAGGTTDIGTRLIAQQLSERLGQPFIVENRPGAGTHMATEAVASAVADGYTLLMATASNAINETLYTRINYNFLRDIVPVAGVIRSPFVLEVNPAVPVKTVPELIDFAKANSGRINLASFGTGTSSHLTGELFKMMAGVEMQHVPYRGSAPMLIDLLSGQVQAAFDNLPASIEHIRSGKLRPLAVTTSMRSDALPDVPALGETLPGFEFERVEWHCSTQEHACRDHREAQQGNQCCSCRPQDQSSLCRAERSGSWGHARRLRKAHLPRNRQVGQGRPGRQHQTGVKPAAEGAIPSQKSERASPAPLTAGMAVNVNQVRKSSDHNGRTHLAPFRNVGRAASLMLLPVGDQ